MVLRGHLSPNHVEYVLVVPSHVKDPKLLLLISLQLQYDPSSSTHTRTSLDNQYLSKSVGKYSACMGHPTPSGRATWNLSQSNLLSFRASQQP